jgi:hypothetical protein
MVYFIHSDATGIVMMPIVYLIMLAGNTAYIIVVVYPRIKAFLPFGSEDSTAALIEDDGADPAGAELENESLPVGLLIEWLFYEFFSFLMLWSHLATMCI